MNTVTVLIPSLDPDEAFVRYVGELIAAGFTDILTVDDGSAPENRRFFDAVEKFPECTVLRHEANRGKGRALKTGFKYFLEKYPNGEKAGIVTADADGQHSAKDTLAVAEALAARGNLVLGTRDFDGPDVPPKSRSGNRITTRVFAMFFGKRVNDTQTGLRGIPYGFLPVCLGLPGERFEYEIRMLMSAVQRKLVFEEVPIETIYYAGNRATHFSAFRDSFRIYKVMVAPFARFAVVGILSFALDIALFHLVSRFVLTPDVFSAWDAPGAIFPARRAGPEATFATHLSIWFSTWTARLFSSLFNYWLNRRSVFRSGEDVTRSMPRYYALCVAQALCSAGFVSLFHWATGWSTTPLKAAVDLVLFFASYHVQRLWVFSPVGKGDAR